MIIYDNLIGLTVYTKHPKENYSSLYREYSLHQDEHEFWSHTERRIISSEWCIYVTHRAYNRLYYSSEVIDFGDYSLVIKKLEPTRFLPNSSQVFAIGLVNGNKLILAKEYLVIDDMYVLYFDDTITRRVSKEVTLCFITKYDPWTV